MSIFSHNRLAGSHKRRNLPEIICVQQNSPVTTGAKRRRPIEALFAKMVILAVCRIVENKVSLSFQSSQLMQGRYALLLAKLLKKNTQFRASV